MQQLIGCWSWDEANLRLVRRDGASLRFVDRARMAAKAPTGISLIPASAPPATITSASPYWIMRIAMPIEWFDVAHADPAEKFGPLRPFMMLSWPGIMLMIVLGT